MNYSSCKESHRGVPRGTARSLVLALPRMVARTRLTGLHPGAYKIPLEGINKEMSKQMRKAMGVDDELKSLNLNRLRRIEGQIRGLHKMVQQDRYCADIIVQVAAVQEALRGVGRNLMKNHLQHCASKAIMSEKPQETAAMYDELLELIYKHLR